MLAKYIQSKTLEVSTKDFNLLLAYTKQEKGEYELYWQVDSNASITELPDLSNLFQFVKKHLT